MDHRRLFKENTLLLNKNDAKRETFRTDRRNKRLDIFNNCRQDMISQTTNSCDRGKTEGTKKPLTRKELLIQWKENRLKEKKKAKKVQPFVVGLVRHNPASPFVNEVSTKVQTNKSSNKQKIQTNNRTCNTNVTKDEKANTVKAFPFSKKKENEQFKFRLKQLTVPVSPTFMSSKKKKNLSEQEKRDLRKHLEEENAAQEVDNSPPTAAAIEVNNLPLLLANNKDELSVNGDTVNNSQKTDVKREGITGRISSPASSSNSLTESLLNTKVTSPLSPLPKDREETPEVYREIKQFVFSPFTGPQQDNDEEMCQPVDSASKKRLSSSLLHVPNEMSPESVRLGQPYYDRIDNETKYLIDKCDAWSKVALLADVPEEICGDIDSVVGQVKLLVQDKFEQFRSLIVHYERNSIPLVTVDDLEGFWDLVYIQVSKMKEQFSKLLYLKEMNWEIKQKQVKPRPMKKIAKKSTMGKSRFREYLKSKNNGLNSKSVMETSHSDKLEVCDSVQLQKEDVQNSDYLFGTERSPARTTNLSTMSLDEYGSNENGGSNAVPLADCSSLYKKALSNSTLKSRRKSSLAMASCTMRSSLIGKAIGTSPLRVVENVPSPENIKSILKKRKESVAENAQGARKKVLFDGKDEIRVTCDDLEFNTTFELKGSDVVCDSVLSPSESLAIPFQPDGGEDTFVMNENLSPCEERIVPRGGRKIGFNTPKPGFTPRRSTRRTPHPGSSGKDLGSNNIESQDSQVPVLKHSEPVPADLQAGEITPARKSVRLLSKQKSAETSISNLELNLPELDISVRRSGRLLSKQLQSLSSKKNVSESDRKIKTTPRKKFSLRPSKLVLK